MTEHARPLDVERIAFVTRRFHELRGLHGVIFGSGLVLAAVMTSAFERPDGSSLQFVMLAMMIANSFVWRRGLWYRRRFGGIVVTPAAEFGAALPVIGMMLGVFLDLFLQTSGRRIPSIAAAVLAASGLLVLARDWRRRPYYVLALAAGLAGTLVTANAPAGRAGSLTTMLPARAHAFLLAYTWVGLAQAIAAFLDHQWLATTLTPRPLSAEPSPNRLTRVASNGRFRASVAGFVLVGSAGSFALGPELSEGVRSEEHTSELQ